MWSCKKKFIQVKILMKELSRSGALLIENET